MAARASGPPIKLRRYHMLDNVNSRTFTPREYQVELLDAARKHNTIVCLGTGTGKTFIAVMVIKELAHQIRDTLDDGGKRTMVVVPTVPLVHQQTKILQDYTDLKVGKYCGFEIFAWTKEMWLNEFRKNNVLVLTADIMKMILHHAFLPLSNINLLIFDECHHAVRNHPYCEIMKCFDVCPPESQPRILGLSASLVNDKCKPVRVEQEIRNLETMLRSTVETASDLTVSSKYGSKPQEFLVLYRPYPSSSLALIKLLAHLNSSLGFFENVNIPWDSDQEDLPHPCKQPRRYMIEITRVVVTLGPWCAKQAIELFLHEIHHMLDTMYSPQHRQYLVMVQTVLLITKSFCEKMLAGKEMLSQLLAYAPPKLEKLLQVLERYKPSESVVENGKDDDSTSYQPNGVKEQEFHVENKNSSEVTAKNSSEVTAAVSGGPDGSTGQGKPMELSKGGSASDEKSICDSVNPSQNSAVENSVCVVENSCNSFEKRNDADATPPEADQKANVKEKKRCNNAYQPSPEDSKALCGVIFVKQRITAYLLNQWLSAMSQHHAPSGFIASNFMIGHGKTAGGAAAKDSAMVFRKQEEVLQKFRSREYNLIVATSVVEEGMDIPKCNLVLHFDIPENFRSYIQSKGRARAPDSLYAVMVQEDEKDRFMETLCDFKIIEEILLQKCHKSDSLIDESLSEQVIDNIMDPYMPVKEDGAPRVTLSSSISLVNRYCAKLPSDTFTRLTPRWKVEEVPVLGADAKYQCTIHLPINSPLKKPITGVLMPSKQLAKMAAALKICEELHKAGELDDNLLPTGKEAVKFEGELMEELREEQSASCTARPGTTKRRQYYFKQVADAIKHSCPEVGHPCYLYAFSMVLTCPIPEEQNTRGRKIHDPADTSRGFGIVTSKPIPLICSFPVFTRSGEVTVYFQHLSSDIVLTAEQLESLGYFHKYTFAEVLRLEKYPMIYNPLEAESSFFVVPVNKSPESDVCSIDWKFVSIINSQKGVKPRKLLEDERQSFEFIDESYADAVVLPWYRNLDKPQFFYVAEICQYLNPKSDFPDTGYETFENYYRKKYSISVMNCKQPLLDVDHTSARLNLLTPRYVNRKGVTLPTSSEQTKRTKRENLQQKQILVPELCVIHPFPASLWRKAVCLPCILYRVNSLLLAEQLRLSVAQAISVGATVLPQDFQWPPLDFGWTLADVLKAQAALKEDECQNQEVPKVKNSNFISREEIGKNVLSDGVLSDHFNSQPYNISESDFEIDVFDPSKFDIPDDDFLVEQELRQINLVGGDPFASLPASNYPLWKPISEDGQSDSPELPMIRYGSPSNFEGTGWDSEWDTDVEDKTTFFSLNLPGLGYISAPGIFNMESLSMDLASCRDDDFWDSMDEDSLFDESEYASSPAPFVNSMPSLEQLCETQQASIRNATKEICESEWLSACSLPLPEFKSEKIDVDHSTRMQILGKREGKMKEIKILSTSIEDKLRSRGSNCLENSAMKFENIYSAVRHIEESQTYLGSEFRDMSSVVNGDAPDHHIQPESVPNNSNNCDVTVEEHSTLAFGELLPNREEVEIVENDPFRVYFDDSPNLKEHPGPSPSIILQAFTMSNANDGINLERLETVGDSFLKYAITAYLFCMYPDIHEGKLSYLRSKQISNLNLYRLGKKKHLGELMVATKFEPNDLNWLPPCYVVPKGLEQALIESGTPAGHWNIGNLQDLTQMSEEQIRQSVMEKKDVANELSSSALLSQNAKDSVPLIPYNLLTQHSIPDKSVADCVEALIGAYLVSCGSRGALLFMSWLGLKVLPAIKHGDEKELAYGYLEPPPSPLLSYVPKAEEKLEKLLSGYSVFEKNIGYTFNDKSYLLQAFTHASYHYNKLTDCYQRLEFLGDAVLDYLITRHLYEDPKKHSPGTLTDLRSALVNNTFFASLAVKYDFHKYFKAISPGLFNVIKKFVELKENDAGYENYESAYYLEEEECEEAEEVEVPKALGDIFESVAGAIYLDSNMSLDTVWRVYFAMMKPEIEYFSTHVPKSPIRELLEMEPQTAKFERAEMTLSGKVRVRVEVFGKGQFVGVGRNKRIAKCTAAKRALRELKKMKKDKESFKGS